MFFSLKNKPCSQTRQGKGKAQIPGIGIIAGLRSSGCSEDCSVRQGNCLILDGHHSAASCTKYLRGIRDSTGRCAGICRGTGIIRGAGIIWCIIRSIGFIRGVRCCGWCCGWRRFLGYYRRRRRLLGYYRRRRRLLGYHRYQDGFWRGYTPQYIEVRGKGENLHNRVCPVTLTAVGEGVAFGVVTEEEAP